MELVEYIFTIPGVTCFLSERLSQDLLENYFGCQRQRGKSNENPNVHQFCSNSQALRVINGTCATVSKGNCRGRKNIINWEQENRPLSKRRKVKMNQSSEKGDATARSTVGEIQYPIVKKDDSIAKLTAVEVQCPEEDTTMKSNDTELQCTTVNQPPLLNSDCTNEHETVTQKG